MKYIDADKLIAEIERRKKQDVTFRERSLLIDMENAIASLQHEHPYFDKVREIKTGRVFLAEYSSEAAEWYEAGTGKAYSISDVEIVKQEQQEVDLEKLKN